MGIGVSVDPQAPRSPQQDVVTGESKEPFVGAYHDAKNYIQQLQNTEVPSATDPPRGGKLVHWKKSDGTDLLIADDDGIRSSFFLGGMTGEMKLWAPSTLPEGWLWCDGALYTVAAQPALYAAIGIKFGGSLGVNFRVPDMRGRLPLGADPTGAQGVVYNLGSYYGNPSSTVNLQHQHGQASHVHGMNNHTHDLSLHTHDLVHSHPMGHDHSVTSHTHTIGSHSHTVNLHSHTFSFGTHSHSGFDHSHTIASHSHTDTGHTHTFTVPSHSHTDNGHSHGFSGNSVASGGPSATKTVQSGSGETVARPDHTHNTTATGSANSGNASLTALSIGGTDDTGTSAIQSGGAGSTGTTGAAATTGSGGAQSGPTSSDGSGTSTDGGTTTSSNGGQTTSASSAASTSNNGTATSTSPSNNTSGGANGNSLPANPALTDAAGSTALNIQPPSAAIGYIIHV